jgi:hypothetical protein
MSSDGCFAHSDAVEQMHSVRWARRRVMVKLRCVCKTWNEQGWNGRAQYALYSMPALPGSANVIKARWEQLRQWMRGWKPVSTREYEALAREFGMITARCLQAEDSLRCSRVASAAMRKQMERDRAAVYGELPGLTPGEIERLAVLSEECGEVVRAIGKIMRYGWESSSPFVAGGRSNRMALERELGSMRAVVNLMLDNQDVRLNAVQSWQRTKKTALENWTLYQPCSLPRDEQLAMMRNIRSSAENATGA